MHTPEFIPTSGEPQEQSLPEQFDNKDNLVELNGKKIRVVDIAPAERKTEVPTLIMPGFSATPEALKDSILRTAEAGRRVISAYAPHGIEVQEERGADLPEAEARKLEMMMRLIDAKGPDKVNVIANSESSIYVAAAAMLYPEKFSHIVFVEPAGLIGEDSFLELIKRVLADIKEEKTHDAEKEKVAYPSPASVGIKSVLSNIRASIKEVQAIAQADIFTALEKIHESGIGVSIIHAVDDKVFPMDRVQQKMEEKIRERMGRLEEMAGIGMIDGFYSVTGTHNSIYQYEPYGRVAEQALSALEEKRKRKNAEYQ